MSFKYPQCQWWINPPPCFSIRPPHVTVVQCAWNDSVLNGTAPPYPVLHPHVSNKPRDRARRMMHDSGFLVAFDVWFFCSEKTTKGFLPLPSATWFFINLMIQVTLEKRTFYQVLLPELSASAYFDIDASDPNFPMVKFIQALFEEMSKEQDILTVEELWEKTLLLDACNNVLGNPKKPSCHGICHGLIFSDNHTSMKAFMTRVKNRLEKRPDHQQLRVLKKGTWVIPLDLNVYSHYQNFRMYGNVKLTPDPEERRPLVVAPYNRNKQMPINELDVFLLSLIDQTREPNIMNRENQIDQSREPVVKKVRLSSNVRVGGGGPLESFLLEQLYKWGNPNAHVASCRPACGDDGLYISFSNANHGPDHKHRSNNLFAIVKIRVLTIAWHCHGHKECKHVVQNLPMNVALEH